MPILSAPIDQCLYISYNEYNISFKLCLETYSNISKHFFQIFVNPSVYLLICTTIRLGLKFDAKHLLQGPIDHNFMLDFSRFVWHCWIHTWITTHCFHCTGSRWLLIVLNVCWVFLLSVPVECSCWMFLPLCLQHTALHVCHHYMYCRHARMASYNIWSTFCSMEPTLTQGRHQGTQDFISQHSVTM